MDDEFKMPKETYRNMYNFDYQEMVINQLKSAIEDSGFTQAQVLEIINSSREKNYQYSPQNLSYKITSGRIQYWETLQIAEILGYEIVWKKIQK